MSKRIKIVTIIGARPQFIKAAVVSRAIRKSMGTQRLKEVLVHTGQHYEPEMSDVFFRTLPVSKPKYNLGFWKWGTRTKDMSPISKMGKMLCALPEVLKNERPAGVLVYGDTNSTLAGALSAAGLKIPIFHVEAGLRSYDRMMSEEINRVLTDHLSTLLFCPTPHAVLNLKKEGITEGVVVTGDVMLDQLTEVLPALNRGKRLLQTLRLESRRFLVLTIHRAENTDDKNRLGKLLDILESLQETCVFPLHPRTRDRLIEAGMLRRLQHIPCVRVIQPLGYSEMIFLEKEARKVLTDSGGVQKEAYLLGTPCLTLRPRTEWIETLRGGWNIITNLDGRAIRQALGVKPKGKPRRDLFGDGHAGGKIVRQIEEFYAS